MKILIVEDDISILKIATLALQKVGGHTVVQACNGIEALSLVVTQNPDLILLDIMMPKLNGLETCVRIKKNPKTSHIPIIFLTAKAQVHEIQNAMSLGALGYIIKPFEPLKLDQNIQDHLANYDKKIPA